jgi:lipopolysaccharide/colanic/teichoic acid biosynthesis glycosyltransferase
MKQQGWRRAVKRATDGALAATGLVLTSPVMAVAAGGVLVAMGRPVFFKQQRPGLHGKPFRLYKLRTMSESRDGRGTLLADGARLTRWGRILRSLSLDELPQLWNVCKGDMSIVGPRPLLVQYLDRYTPEQARRHDVLPGITGWAQINGRNAISWEEKFAHDVWYVDHWSLGLDARIMARTILTVLRGRGISRSGQATMDEFTGSPKEPPVDTNPEENSQID